MKDLFVEIFETIKRNKLRTCLTGFAVSWGIFMLIVLLGAGNGLLNSFNQGAGDISVNTMMVGGGTTSKPYDGLKQGRRINLEDADIKLTESKSFDDIVDDVIATVSTSVTAANGGNTVSGNLEGDYPDRQKMDKLEILHGRFINDLDIKEERKVVVIPEDAAEQLMGTATSLEDFLGQSIEIGNFAFKVVGISKSDSADNMKVFYAPFTTVKLIFGKGKYIDDLTFSFHGLDTEEENEEFEKTYKAAVNTRHRAAPDDGGAIWIWNRFTQSLQMKKGGNMISTALWIIGLFTLLSGVVGVSNIMLITVKERTHEFGIRKAIGASPWSITKLIIAESVLITAFFGYIGMLLGLGACEYLDATLGHSTMSVLGEQIAMLVNPTVGVSEAIKATVVLILAGTLAGFFPARRAAKVRPIEALRAE